MGDTAERFPDGSRLFRIAWLAISWVPTRRGSKWRRRLLKSAGATIGERVRVGPGVKILGPSGLTIGDRTGVARDACLDARGGLTIGADTMVGFESVLLSLTHRYDNVDMLLSDQGHEAQSITVGSDVWLGARAFVLPGVEIGDSAIVGTASVVTRPVAANTIVAGSPAKVLRQR